MVLNTNNLSVADHQQFMKDAIEATKDDGIQWKIVVYHHSIYSTAKHAADTDVTQLREALPRSLRTLVSMWSCRATTMFTPAPI